MRPVIQHKWWAAGLGVHGNNQASPSGSHVLAQMVIEVQYALQLIPRRLG
jgi:hypothetical protein